MTNGQTMGTLLLFCAIVGAGGVSASPDGATCATGGETTCAATCATGAQTTCATTCGASTATTHCAPTCGLTARPLSDPAAGVRAPAGPSAADRGLVDLAPILEPVRAYHRVPALAIALVRDGEIHAIGAVGTRAVGSMRPVELDDQWHLGSCGKAFTATAAAALVEAGRIDWGTTIAEVYPEMVGRIRPAYEPVTLTQLLMHRGGYVARDARFDDAVAVTDGTIPTRRAAAVRFASSRESIADPGTAFAYTDVGYTVAGALLERVTGSTWEALVVEHVADPLSLASLGFGAPGSEEAVDQPRGHVLVDGKLKPLGTGPGQDLANPVIGPAGTIHASMADWATFARAHLKGARGEANGLLAPTTIQRLHADSEGQGYAIGWGVSANPWGEGRALSHSGSCGAWSALIWILPEANAAIVGATNVGSAFDAVADAMDRVMRMP